MEQPPLTCAMWDKWFSKLYAEHRGETSDTVYEKKCICAADALVNGKELPNVTRNRYDRVAVKGDAVVTCSQCGELWPTVKNMT